MADMIDPLKRLRRTVGIATLLVGASLAIGIFIPALVAAHARERHHGADVAAPGRHGRDLVGDVELFALNVNGRGHDAYYPPPVAGRGG